MSPWKKGRGKLGFLQPLLGSWVAEASSSMGPLRCTRTFEHVLNGAFVQLTAQWKFGPPDKEAPAKVSKSSSSKSPYQELALIGAGSGGAVEFWSFTSDGTHSHGVVVDVTDLHPDAIGFQAEMPAGIARMAYWPADDDDGEGFHWVVESKTKKGWKRFVEHRYRSARALDRGQTKPQ